MSLVGSKGATKASEHAYLILGGSQNLEVSINSQIVIARNKVTHARYARNDIDPIY